MSRFDWIQNPFLVEVEKVCHLTLKAQEELAELSSDSSLKTMFAKMSLNSFWAIVEETLTSGKYVSLCLISILYIYIYKNYVTTHVFIE